MKKQVKEYETLHCKIDKEIAEKLHELCEKSGLTKTKAVERALQAYFENYKSTGKS